MRDLSTYIADRLARAGVKAQSGEIFAKVLTTNDDAGRHGVLVPSEAYDFFPALSIPDPGSNATTSFPAFLTGRDATATVRYKYYQRYPERRLTRLESSLNNTARQRLLVVLKATARGSNAVFVVDTATDEPGGRFAALWSLVAGSTIAATPGAFVTVPFDFSGIEIDEALGGFLEKFDALQGRWIESMRGDDTGIGYTFETLLGIEENNSKLADFHGIEIKCKRAKERRTGAGGKLNLFQQAPTWAAKMRGIERLQMLGRIDADGRLACYSQVNTAVNNLGLFLVPNSTTERIGLQKGTIDVGHWTYATLSKRLLEKHSRAVFVKAQCRTTKGKESFLFDEVVYCAQPSIERFVDLVTEDKLVFEFLMSQSGPGVRNHGYPWRLLSDGLLDRLFLLIAKLR